MYEPTGLQGFRAVEELHAPGRGGRLAIQIRERTTRSVII